MDIRFKRAILIFGIVFILLLLLYAYRSINLIIKEDIILEVDSTYKSIWLDYGEKYEFEVNTKINNYWLCKAECHAQIIDLSDNEYLLNETFYVTNNKQKRYTATIEPERGYGQKIYQYTIECINTRSANCPVSDNSYKRTSTLAVNYKPNPYQLKLIDNATSKFNELSQELAFSEQDINAASNILYNLDVNFAKYLKENNKYYNDILNDLKDTSKDILSNWRKDLYEYTFSQILDIYEKSKDLFLKTTSMLNETTDTVIKHNTVISQHLINIENTELIKIMAQYYPENISEFEEYYSTSLTLININTNTIDQKAPYDKLLREIIFESINVNSTMDIFNNKSAETKKDYLDLYLADKLSCEVLGCFIHNYSFTKGIDDVKNRCMIYTEVIERYNKAKTITQENRAQYNESLSEIDLEEKRHVLYIIDSFQTNNDSIIGQRVSYYHNISNTTPASGNNTMLYDMKIVPLTQALNNIKEYCTRPEINITMIAMQSRIQIMPNYTETIKPLTLSTPEEKCCLKNKCSICGTGNKYPVLLIHGFSINKKNSAYKSTNVFNEFETELLKDNYISMGAWSINSVNIIRTNARLLFKPTYYLTSYSIGTNTIESKDETLEVYSDRLKEIIDNIKLITGKEKVEIVAHSMGGLITRRYIQKYGTEDVNTLILVGTPNKGIDDNTYELCKTFGNKKECNDMKHDSEFIKLVNQDYPMPKTYLIIGTGCDMQGKEGDGIVLKENSELKNYQAYYINGTCTITSFLHSGMARPKEHPEVLKKIIEIIG